MNTSSSAAFQISSESVRTHECQAYYQIANRALQLEQAAEYTMAAKVWANAQSVSCNALNQYWSEKRAEFCLKQKERSKILCQ
ncbi:ANR family transcriptional regulator [Cedecea neteri]|uniref:ANR family transcriptional regulator n=1 Tax=Cedecea neteri TaxID=158822 RepID=UPI00318395CF